MATRLFCEFVILSILLHFSSSLENFNLINNCHESFKLKCKCGIASHDGLLKYVTNCTDSGFTDATMLKFMNELTEVLIFTGNRIPDLPFNIFDKNKTYGKLEMIDFSNNHIQSIKGKTFHNVDFVRTLILDNNDLYIVSRDHHPRVFSNFINLENLSLRNTFTDKLHSTEVEGNLYEIFVQSDLMSLQNLNLEHNEIKFISDDLFCMANKLRKLYLGGNMIQDIDFNITCLPHLELIDLHNNLVPYLSSSAIKQLYEKPGLKLNLTGNPFSCNCYMVESGMHQLLHSQRSDLMLIDKNLMYCSTGDINHIGKPLMSVHLSRCPKPKNEQPHHSNAGIVILSIVLALMCAFLIGSAYLHRSNLRLWLGNAIIKLRSKGLYSSLDRNEEDKEMDV